MKHDWKTLHNRWKTSNVTKKEFAEQRGLPYPSLIAAFKKLECTNNVPSNASPSLVPSSFSKIEVSTEEKSVPKIVIITANGTRVEVPV